MGPELWNRDGDSVSKKTNSALYTIIAIIRRLK